MFRNTVLFCFALFLGVAVGGEQSTGNGALSLLLLPAVAGDGLPQLAVDLEPSLAGVVQAEGEIELWVHHVNGTSRPLAIGLGAKRGTQLIGIDVPLDVLIIEARWLTAQGAVLATGSVDVRSDPFVSFGPKREKPATTQKAMVTDWYGWGESTSLNDTILSSVLWDDGTGPALVIGGNFTGAGVAGANYIARWDGSAWSPLGSGMNNPVWALTVDGSLIAGGYFTSAGGVGANRIARWDGSAWSPLGSGMNNNVYALTVDGSGDLNAGGAFTSAGVAGANYIARWDGSAWSPLGWGMDNTVLTLTVDGSGDLIAGGYFTRAGGVAANRIARWDGGAWSPLGSNQSAGMNNTVRALTVDGSGDLIAGGRFTSAGVAGTSRIARWDGSAWSPLGSGMNNNVYALTVDGSGDLIAGGNFTSAGGVGANHIARWDGSAWSPLGSGMNISVFVSVLALTVDGSGDVIAGGNFTSAGGQAIPYIAAYGTAETTQTEVLMATPLSLNQPTTLVADVTVMTGTRPDAGLVSFVGLPAGACSDLTLSPVDATTAEASCQITFTELNTYQVTAQYSGGTSAMGRWLGSKSASFEFSPPFDQTIAFTDPGNQAYSNGGTFGLTATATSGLVVAFSSATSGVCTVSGTTVTIIALGTCTINADQAGDGNYNPAPQVQRSVTISKADQTIAFTDPGNQAYSNGSMFSLTATATSGLVVAFSSVTPGVCTVSGPTVTIIAVGTCTIDADQAGDGNYNPAPQMQRSVMISKANQTIMFSDPGNQTYSNGGTFSLTATATSDLVVAFSSVTPGVCTVSGPTVTILAAGTCTINANQAGDGNYNPAPQVQRPIAILTESLFGDGFETL